MYVSSKIPSSHINLREGALETRWPRLKFLQELEGPRCGELDTLVIHISVFTGQVVALSA